MLNEKQEWNLYLTQGYGNLLRDDNLKEALSGIRRPMTVLARGFLTACHNLGITNIAQAERYTIDFLISWLLGTPPCDDTYPEPLRTLCDRAAAASLSKHLLRNNIQPDTSYITGRVEDWKKSLFETDHSHQSNTLNQINFKCIVADALLQGPLKNEILLLRKKQHNFGLDGNFNEHHREFLLSIVACFLQYCPADCNSVVLPLAELSNYMNKPRNKGTCKTYKSVSPFIDRGGYTYKDRLLLIKDLLAQNCTKLTVNSQWLTDMDVHLAPADTPVPKGYIAYNDDTLRNVLLLDKTPTK